MRTFTRFLASVTLLLLGAAPTASAAQDSGSPTTPRASALQTTTQHRPTYQQTSPAAYDVSCWTLINTGTTPLSVRFSDAGDPVAVQPQDIVQIPDDYSLISVTDQSGATVDGPTAPTSCTPTALVSCTQVINVSAAPFSIAFDGGDPIRMEWFDVIDVPQGASTYQIFDRDGEVYAANRPVPTNCPPPPTLSITDKCGVDNDVLTISDAQDWTVTLVPGELTPQNVSNAVSHPEVPAAIGTLFPNNTTATVILQYAPRVNALTVRTSFGHRFPQQDDPASTAFLIETVAWTNVPCPAPPSALVTCTQVINNGDHPFLVSFDDGDPVEVPAMSFLNIADVTDGVTPTNYSIWYADETLFRTDQVPTGCEPVPVVTLVDRCELADDVMTVKVNGEFWTGKAYAGPLSQYMLTQTPIAITNGTYVMPVLFPDQTTATIIFELGIPVGGFASVTPRQGGTTNINVWIAQVSWSDVACVVPTSSSSTTTTTATSTTTTTIVGVTTTTQAGWMLPATGLRLTVQTLAIAAFAVVVGLLITGLARRRRPS
ncbi:MAG TPA: hypothetical protein PKV27_01455 [Ilumatobacteraceae bacterium]|nr:hypothetical protein [Ilumatobacteraceae bacterium]